MSISTIGSLLIIVTHEFAWLFYIAFSFFIGLCSIACDSWMYAGILLRVSEMFFAAYIFVFFLTAIIWW